MIIRKLICLLLVCLLAAAPVYADDSVPDETEAPIATDYTSIAEESDDGLTDMFGSMSASQQSFLDNWDAIMSGDPTNEWNQLAFEVPSTVDSIASLNLQFTSLQERMSLQGFGSDMQLKVPEFQPGYSFSITDAFAQSFGDVGHLTMDAKLPEGWNMANIMATAKNARNIAEAEFKSSDLFQYVSSNISYGNVLDNLGDISQYTTSHKDEIKNTLNNLDTFISKPLWISSYQAATARLNTDKAAAFESLTITGLSSEEIEKMMDPEIIAENKMRAELSAADEQIINAAKKAKDGDWRDYAGGRMRDHGFTYLAMYINMFDDSANINYEIAMSGNTIDDENSQKVIDWLADPQNMHKLIQAYRKDDGLFDTQHDKAVEIVDYLIEEGGFNLAGYSEIYQKYDWAAPNKSSDTAFFDYENIDTDNTSP